MARNKTQKVLAVLISVGKASNKEWADLAGLDRKTLRRYANRLVSDGLVYREEGKFGHFLPTKKAKKNEKFFDTIGLELRRLFAKSVKFKLGQDTKNMLDYSNAVGAFITYILIQSLNPENRFITKTKGKTLILFDEARWVERLISQLTAGIALVFTFHQNVFFDIEESFSSYNRLYPGLYKELEGIWSRLSLLLKIETEHRKYRKITTKRDKYFL